jgi:hypothetical protein
MDWTEISKSVAPILALILGNAAFIVPLFLWNRSESRADIRVMDSKLESFRAETTALIQSIQQEMKDFHGRLCAIEERNRIK